MSPTPTSPAPSAARHAFHGAWLCHKGRVRRENEDACLVGRQISSEDTDAPVIAAADDGRWMVVVSDGIGGHLGGAEASCSIVETLAACERVTPLAVRETLLRLNKRLCERGRKNPEFSGMGATVAGLGSGLKGLFAFNVGDSRVYRVDGAHLVQITRDDSEAEELIEMGLLTRDDAVRPGYLHALTQAIGGRAEAAVIQVHLHPLVVETSARFLICSDGVTDMVGPAEIEAAMISGKSPELLVGEIFTLAMEAGGMDNITLAVIDVAPQTRSRPGSAQK